MQILSGHFALDSDEALSTIKSEFSHYNKQSGLVIFVFCPRSSKYYDQLAKGVDFWNRYSDKYVTILIPGYAGDLSSPDKRYNVNAPTEFFFDSFRDVYAEIEKATTWKYKGGTDLIGVMAEKKSGNKLTFSWRNALVVNIEAIDFDGNFDLSQYVVSLINAAQKSPEDPLLEFGKQNALNFIVSIIKAAMPERFKAAFEAAVKCNLRRNVSRA